ALDRAAAHAELERAAERAARLQEVTAAFSEALTPYDVATVAVTRGCAALGAPRGWVGLLREDGTVVDMLATLGFPDEAAAEWQVPIGPPTPVTDAVRSGKALFFASLMDVAARHRDVARIHTIGEGAAAAIPLVAHANVIGAMGLFWDEHRSFDVS